MYGGRGGFRRGGYGGGGGGGGNQRYGGGYQDRGTDGRNMCRTFQQNGNCRFGDRCRYSHSQPKPNISKETAAAVPPKDIDKSQSPNKNDTSKSLSKAATSTAESPTKANTSPSKTASETNTTPSKTESSSKTESETDSTTTKTTSLSKTASETDSTTTKTTSLSKTASETDSATTETESPSKTAPETDSATTKTSDPSDTMPDTNAAATKSSRQRITAPETDADSTKTTSSSKTAPETDTESNKTVSPSKTTKTLRQRISITAPETVATPTKATSSSKTGPETDKESTKTTSLSKTGSDTDTKSSKTTSSSKTAPETTTGPTKSSRQKITAPETDTATTKSSSENKSVSESTETTSKNVSNDSSRTSKEGKTDIGADSSKTSGDSSVEVSDTQDNGNKKDKAGNKENDGGAADKDHNEKSKDEDTSQAVKHRDTQQKENETLQNESNLEKDSAIISRDESSSSVNDKVQKDKNVKGAEESESMEVDESMDESKIKNSESEKEKSSNIEKDNAENNTEVAENETENMETDPVDDLVMEPDVVEDSTTELETNALEDDTDMIENEEDKSEDRTETDNNEKDGSSAKPKKEGGEDEDDEIMEVPVVKKPAPIVDLVDDDEEARKEKKDKSSGVSSNADSQTDDNSGDVLCNNVSEGHIGDIVENAGDIIGADDMLGLRISSVVGGEDCITGIDMDEENCHEHDAIQDIQIENVMTLQEPSSPQDPSAMDQQEDEAEKGEEVDKVGESEKSQETKEGEKEKDTEKDKDKSAEDAEDKIVEDKEKDSEKDKTAEDKEKDDTEKDKDKDKESSTETASTKDGEKDLDAEAEGGKKNSEGGSTLKIVSLTSLADKDAEEDPDATQKSSETPLDKTTEDTPTSTSAPKIRLSSAVSAVATESDVYFVLRSAVMMPKACESCKKESQCQFRITKRGEAEVLGYLCSQECKTKWCTELPPNKSVGKARLIFEKCCGMCGKEMNSQSLADQYAWETRDFCSAKCVEEHLVSVASKCHQCQTTVGRSFVGKYCVRFGSDIHQFCTNSCLEKYKTNIKVCCYCQKNLSSSTATNVVSPSSNKEYCSTKCLKRNQRKDIGQQNFTEKSNCTVCQNNNINRYEFILNGEMTQLCSDPCLNVYKYANKVKAVPCCLCQRLMNAEDVAHFIFHDGRLLRVFCTDSCLNTFILSARKIKVCTSCKVKKYNFDMVSKHREEGQEDQHFCSLNCLSIGEGRGNMISSSSNGTTNSSSSSSGGINSNNQTTSSTTTEDTLSNCNMCSRIAKAQYHMVMSDNSLRNFCSYDCATKYKTTYGFLVTGVSKTSTSSTTTTTTTTTGKNSDSSKNNMSAAEAMKAAQDLLSLLNPPVMVNKMTWCRPQQVTKGVYCKPHPWHKSTQTDAEDDRPPPIIPVPIPIYVPTPMMMYNAPLPVPIFIPIPIPVPIFIPTTAQTTKGIKETLEKLKDELPDDPFEAEMLLLAKRTAEEAEESSGTPKEDTTAPTAAAAKTGNVGGSSSSGYNASSSSNTGKNLQAHNDTNDQDAYTALSHLESCLEASMEDNGEDEMDETDTASLNLLEDEFPRFPFRLHGDGSGKRYRGGSSGRGHKRRRVGSGEDDDPDDPDYGQEKYEEEYSDTEYYHEKDQDQEQLEGPFLNSNYGLSAWKHWVQRKNSELSRLSSTSRPMKLFKEDLLSLNCDELNNALCIFLKDLRKPSGEEFQGDTVFYLLLGIQQYLFACARTDCIFMDFGFERFTTGLDDICKRFLEELAADSLAGSMNIFGTRITEDMLWESRQLGAHTPQVLLNTLFYFNTKVFRLKTVEEHVAISFVQIVKQWKRANVGREGQVQRMTLLRYFPKKSANTGKPADWQGYYMYENKDDPLRCPVKLYEFYLSKCPESVRNTRNIYYVYPERSCVPDSPVWFSTQPLHPESLSKMLNRALIVREVQEVHSQP